MTMDPRLGLSEAERDRLERSVVRFQQDQLRRMERAVLRFRRRIRRGRTNPDRPHMRLNAR